MASAADMVEADVWYGAGKVWVRHEPRPGPLPLLVDKRMRGHSLPPWSLPLGRRWYLRLDIDRLSLDEVLETLGGAKGLLVDVKGSYPGHENRRFAAALVRTLREHGAENSVAICGQYWPVLDEVRSEAPDLEVRYSVERVFQWDKFMRLVGDDERVRRVCIEHRFLNEERVRFLEGQGVNVYCWTVDDRDEARRLAASGVDGVISNDLALLGALGEAIRPAGEG
jgi:glycerophosphoryl diester phosphodiesterase